MKGNGNVSTVQNFILSNQKQPTPILTFHLKGKGLSSSTFKGEARRGMG